jgi:hypothetical protein
MSGLGAAFATSIKVTCVITSVLPARADCAAVSGMKTVNTTNSEIYLIVTSILGVATIPHLGVAAFPGFLPTALGTPAAFFLVDRSRQMR